jgi:hypothetical protein
MLRLCAARLSTPLQPWKLLALATSCFAPKHYALAWLLRAQLNAAVEEHKWCAFGRFNPASFRLEYIFLTVLVAVATN